MICSVVCLYDKVVVVAGACGQTCLLISSSLGGAISSTHIHLNGGWPTVGVRQALTPRTRGYLPSCPCYPRLSTFLSLGMSSPLWCPCGFRGCPIPPPMRGYRWRYIAVGQLPPLHIICTFIPLKAQPNPCRLL